jgi:hypothetical protein
MKLGYNLVFYDMVARYTEKFMRDATAAGVRSVHNGILGTNHRAIFQKTMAALTTRTPNGSRRANNEGVTVYEPWDGTDSYGPASYVGKQFSNTHSHYLVSGAAI